MTRRLFATAARLILVPAAVAYLASCATPLEWSPYPGPETMESLSSAEWLGDLDYLVAELPARNPHFDEDPAMAGRFRAFAAELREDWAGGVEPHSAITGLARLLALVGEGHTSLNSYPTRYLPLIAHHFSDGWFVAGVDRPHADVLGARVLGIRAPDGRLVEQEQLEALLDSVISVDHENGYRPARGTVLVDPCLMRGLGLADASGVSYRLETAAGVLERRIAPKDAADLDIVRASDDAATLALSRSRDEANWYVRDGSVVYLSYDECEMDAYDLFRRVIDEVLSQSTETLVVDLRENSGGTSVPGTWFASRLAELPDVNVRGRLYVLIGPNTFSSGMMLAVDLMEKTEAVFVGEPLAESPNSWGEVVRFALPNSGLVVGHSTKFFAYGRGKNLRLDEDGNLVPDEGFEVSRSFSDYATGRDPVLERVLFGRPR